MPARMTVNALKKCVQRYKVSNSVWKIKIEFKNCIIKNKEEKKMYFNLKSV